MRIAVLLSGGVDSSLALHLLRREGHEIVAFYLKVWLEEELAHLGNCPWEEDLVHARGVCEREGVPLEIVSLQRAYHHHVVAHLLSELVRGRTPSPDVWCNERIKFGAFLAALPAGFDAVASGHYARLERRAGRARLLTAADPVKDQTYFLCRLSGGTLERLRFPLGALPKAEVRRLAATVGLPNAERPDSQGICFLGRLRYRDFVAAQLGERPGPIVEAESGQAIGRHRGHWFHTVGQRKGLGLSGGPWYVVGKDAGNDTVLVSRDPLAAGKPVRRVWLPAPSWVGAPPAAGGSYRAKLRHGPETVPVTIESAGPDGWRLLLGRPDPGLAAGQFAVLYDGEECLGGGEMEIAAPRLSAASAVQAAGTASSWSNAST